MSKREIELHLQPGESGGPNAENLWSAIGYLSTWAIDGASGWHSGKCTIYQDSDCNLNATYRNPGGERTYFIFGLRGDDGSYSFHS